MGVVHLHVGHHSHAFEEEASTEWTDVAVFVPTGEVVLQDDAFAVAFGLAFMLVTGGFTGVVALTVPTLEVSVFREKFVPRTPRPHNAPTQELVLVTS